MTEIGPVAVTTARDSVQRFTAAAHGSADAWDGATVPMTFPAVWLGLPEIRQGLSATDANPVALLHEAQEFHYFDALELDASYVMHVAMAPAGNERARVVVTARVVDRSERTIVLIKTSLIVIRDAR